MKADHVRLNIYISAKLADKLRAVSYLSRKPKSKLVSEALEMLLKTPPTPQREEKI